MSNQDGQVFQALKGMLKASPQILLLTMALSFLIMSAVQTFFYQELFTGKVPNSTIALVIGLCVAVIVQASRFAFGLSGAFEFAYGQMGRGMIGLLFSLGITIFEAYEVHEIATIFSTSSPTTLGLTTFNEDNYNASFLILQFICWIGFALEARLAITLSGQFHIHKEENTKKEVSPAKLPHKKAEEIAPELDELITTNGQGKY